MDVIPGDSLTCSPEFRLKDAVFQVLATIIVHSLAIHAGQHSTYIHNAK